MLIICTGCEGIRTDLQNVNNAPYFDRLFFYVSHFLYLHIIVCQRVDSKNVEVLN